MSHEEQGTAYDPHARGHELQGRKSAPCHGFNVAEHIRTDWSVAYCIEFLEARARGYNGTLRQVLCTAAHGLRTQQAALLAHEEAADAAAKELDEVVNEMRVQGERAEMVDCSALMLVGVEEDGS